MQAQSPPRPSQGRNEGVPAGCGTGRRSSADLVPVPAAHTFLDSH
jgi:hypothetical protein